MSLNSMQFNLKLLAFGSIAILATIAFVECGGGAKGGADGGRSARSGRNFNPELAEAAGAAVQDPPAVADEALAVSLQAEENRLAVTTSNGTGGRAISDETLAKELQADEDNKGSKKRKIVPVIKNSATSQVFWLNFKKSILLLYAYYLLGCRHAI